MSEPSPHNAPPAPGDARQDFRERAIREAQRYGADPWIFVRELLQNARDAGATRVEFLFKESDRLAELHCLDDGEGMAWEHAQTYLFSLYTSSKESAHNKAGRFGVGFWSVLRFGPTQIEIRSKPRGAHISQGWGLCLDGQLRRAKPTPPAKESGTTVTLSRPKSGQDDAQRLFECVRDHGRFLTQRDHPDRPLEIRVNGVCINEPFSLPAPSLRFHARNVRGVVGLGPHGQVELFSRGLRIRNAATLDDLLSSKPPQRSWIPAGLNVAPRILLDCDNIEVLLHRSDVRENGDLKRALRLARTHLRRLVEAQLSGVRRAGLQEQIVRLTHWLQERPRLARGLGAAALVVSLSSATVFGLRWQAQTDKPHAKRRPLAPAHVRASYRGAQVQTLSDTPLPALDLRYTPAQTELYFRHFAITDLERGTPDQALTRTAYHGASCQNASMCTSVDVSVQGQSQAAPDGLYPLSIPEATGFRIDARSIEYIPADPAQRTSLRLAQDLHGEPWILSSAPLTGQLRYQMAPATAPRDPDARHPIRDPAFAGWNPAQIPAGDDAPQRAMDLVARRIRYSVEQDVAQAHQRAIEEGRSVFDRALGLRAGDCDVQNTVLAALLREMGYSARLAIGYVGQNGSVAPTMHAWVEYRSSPELAWSIADASQQAIEQAPQLLAQGPPAEDARAPGATHVQAKDASESPTQTPTYWWWWVLGGSTLIALGVYVSRQGRVDPASVDESQQRLRSLLLGALEHPESFSGIPGVFHRKLVSCLGSGPLSLRDIEHAHRHGRLWVADRGHAIAQRAILTQDKVLDGRCPLAQTVAGYLQPIDLDLWQGRWEARCEPHEALARIHAVFDRMHLSIRIVVSTAIQGSCEALCMGPRPVDATVFRDRELEIPARCLVFYAPDAPLLRALESSPGPWERFELAKHALEHFELETTLRARTLGCLAQEAQEERAA